jgi:hypothetical protein
MLNLFRRQPAAKPAAQPAAQPGARPATPAPAQADMFYLMEVIARAIERFVDHASFAGAFDQAPGFRCQTMPNGIQIAANRDRRVGVVLDTRAMGMEVAQCSMLELAAVAASTYFRNYQKQDPAWKVSEDPGQPRKMTAIIPFGTAFALHLECKGGTVDTQFDRQTEPGASLTMMVKPKA